ncbi:MAG: hypothetical protein HY719_13650, partial [Planctomycetes bacterium]|nr:hypothetical protein [Planctomycetota bacterium]
ATVTRAGAAGERGAAAGAEPARVSVARVEEAPRPRFVRQSGVTRPKKTLRLTSEVGGRVVRRPYGENETTGAERGDVLYEVAFVDTAITVAPGWRIVKLYYEVGETIRPFTLVADLINYDTVILDFQVTQAQRATLEALPETARVVRFTAVGLEEPGKGGRPRPREFEARIARLFPTVDPATRKYRVEAEYHNPEGAPAAVGPDLLVECAVLLSREPALRLPAGAVREEFHQAFCYAVDPDPAGGFVARACAIEVAGDHTDQHFLFVERLLPVTGRALRAGDLVVTEGLERMRDGAPVVFAPPAAPAPAGGGPGADAARD